MFDPGLSWGGTVKIKVPMVDDEVLQDDERSKKTKSVFPCLAADISRLEPSCLPKGQIINPPVAGIRLVLLLVSNMWLCVGIGGGGKNSTN